MEQDNTGTAKGSTMSIAVPWLLGAKVAVPARVDAYFNRSQTFEWSEAAGSGIVVMQAPGGFGKTTLLGEIYRRERERGVLAAWLTLDEDDTAEGVGAYLAYAFERAGLDTPAASDAFEHSMGLVARSIEAHAGPCLLVGVFADMIAVGAMGTEALAGTARLGPIARMWLKAARGVGLGRAACGAAVIACEGLVVGSGRMRTTSFTVVNGPAECAPARGSGLLVGRQNSKGAGAARWRTASFLNNVRTRSRTPCTDSPSATAICLSRCVVRRRSTSISPTVRRDGVFTRSRPMARRRSAAPARGDPVWAMRWRTGHAAAPTPSSGWA